MNFHKVDMFVFRSLFGNSLATPNATEDNHFSKPLERKNEEKEEEEALIDIHEPPDVLL